MVINASTAAADTEGSQAVSLRVSAGEPGLFCPHDLI